MAGPTNAQLTEQLSEMTKRATTAEARAARQADEHAYLRDAHAKLSADHSDRGRELDAATKEARGLTASLTAYKGSATKARNEATVLKKQLSPEARPIGAMKPPRNEAEAAERAEALAAAFAQDTTELVFSDGKREIRELAPLVVTGDAWRDTPGGRVLNHEPLLEPGDCSRESFVLRGFGLVNSAGEQVAYQALPDGIEIGRNQTFQLPHRTIRF